MTVAALVAKKALESAAGEAGEAGWGVVARVSQRVREWFLARRGEGEVVALELVEAAPDSRRAVEALAGAVTRAAREEPDIAGEVQALVEEVERTGDAQVSNFVVQVRDEAKVGRIIQVTGDYHEH